MNRMPSVPTSDVEAAIADEVALAVTVWGARGSLPASGPDYNRYGGATCAVEVTAGHRSIVFDAGTGIVPMGAAMRSQDVRDIDLFLTHLHYDHVMGLPYFGPLHDPNTRLRIHLGGASDAEAQDRVADYFRQPFFPITLDAFPAEVSIHGIPEGVHALDTGLHLTTLALAHPQGATGFRLDRDGVAFAYITDFEHDGGRGDEAVMVLAHRADLALLDATYTPQEYARRHGWGHAHWRAAGDLASRAEVQAFGLFHHRHDRTDDDLGQIEALARNMFPRAFAARAGQIFML